MPENLAGNGCRQQVPAEKFKKGGNFMAKLKQKITPNLWFDKEAREAADFYSKVFPESKITSTTMLHDTPSGDTEIVSFEVWGFKFMAISAGPLFKFNPSISFMVNFDPSIIKNAREKIDEVWNKLSDGGHVLMALDKYPFSERYGWLQDKYGLSWQLIYTDPQGDERPTIIPSLLFVGDVYGKAEEATKFYTSVFSQRDAPANDSKMGTVVRYGPGQEPDKEEAVMFADFKLFDTWFAAMDSAREHNFSFNEAISFMVYCNDQKEIDYYWKKLSAVPEAEQCGWLKDKFGVSWQITAVAMDEMLKNGTREQVDRVTQAFLPMKKLVIADLEKAYGVEEYEKNYPV
ncbi:MAG TPA: VOC family protein [Chitinophagaceae bacterium]|nr:VOC family protein [Chitinophagaceae bacterium]